MYDKKKSQSMIANKTAAPPPPTCQKNGCNEDTVIVFMKVFNKNTGKTEVNGFSSCDRPKKSAYGYATGKEIIMYEQFDYIGWIALCGSCYQIDLHANGKRSYDLAKQHGDMMLKNTDKSGENNG